MTWRDLAQECRQSALHSMQQGSHRAVLNRCYYAIFSDIAHGAVLSGMTMPVNWEGPHHKPVHEGTIIANRLSKWLRPNEQGRLIAIVADLYRLRLLADYTPSVGIGEGDARVAIGRLLIALRISEKVQ